MTSNDDKHDQDLRVPILTKLFRNDLWGKSYTTIQNSLSKIPNHDKGKGKEEIDKMEQDGLVQIHKGGECISLNTSAKKEIEDLLEDHLPDFYF
jgi:hypothetical protein